MSNSPKLDSPKNKTSKFIFLSFCFSNQIFKNHLKLLFEKNCKIEEEIEWDKVRENWLKPKVRDLNGEKKKVIDINELDYELVYTEFQEFNGRFSKRIPLSYLVSILQDTWEDSTFSNQS